MMKFPAASADSASISFDSKFIASKINYISY
jgi:hypothetical protein